MPKKRTKEELKRKMNVGDKEEDVYTEAGREELLDEDDEISGIEEGFMEGYTLGERTFQCATCKKILDEFLVEEEIDGRLLRFCSTQCATRYEEKH